MTMSVTLICPQNISLSIIAKVLNKEWDGKVFTDSLETPEYQINYSGRGLHIYELIPGEEVFEDYSTNEFLPEVFTQSLNESHRYFDIGFSIFELAKDVIEVLLMNLLEETTDIWFDSEYCWVLRGKDILYLIQKHPDFDWRTEKPPLPCKME